ncbi:MAG: hypothetical protein IT353_24820 [Gemmatimonadaceae bacterium]|nr:hypothetical protein [Gemmatimonadaceae bacterium]
MWFPVIAEQTTAAERSLGIALPPRYKRLMSDALVRQSLADPHVGAIALDRTMADHVRFVQERAMTLPGFPAHAVIAADNGGRYVRYWVPDPQRPGILGEMVYSWDTVARRGIKDAASSTIIRSMLSLLQPREPAPRRVEIHACIPALARSDAGASADTPQWRVCGTFDVHGAVLTACDAGLLPDRSSSPSVVSGAGVYRVETWSAAGDDSAPPVVAAIRIVRADARPTHCVALADIDVDHAAIAVYDRQHFMRRVRTGDRDRFVEDVVEVTDRLAVIGMRGLQFAVRAATAAGDGTVTVLSVCDGATTVGLLVELRSAVNLDRLLPSGASKM